MNVRVANHRCSSLAGLALLALAAALGCSRRPELGKLPDLTTAASIRTAMMGDAAAGGAAAATGTGWGTLKGKFTFAGDKPTLPPYPVNKDESVCAPGGTPPEQQYLEIDAGTKGIANIAIIVRKVSRVHESAEPKTEGETLFDQKGCVFLSHMTPIFVGQTLGIKNSDPVGHNTNIGGANTFNQTIPAGQVVPVQIKKEDAVPAPVRCSIHPWMISYLLPRKNGYFAVTKPDGTFEIPNLPAGEKLEIQVWHEWAAGPQGGLVLDAPELKDLKWSKKGRFNLTLKEDETRDLELTVPPSAFKPI